MTTSPHTSRRKLTRQPSAGRRAWWVLAGTLRFVGRVLRGLAATAVLLALMAGLPWALWHYIGWPLPDHIPTWDEVQATLLNPMSAQFLLNTLACLCWIVWFFFTIDVMGCAVEAARGITWPEFRPTGPLRGFAAALIGTIVLTVLGNRTPTARPATSAVLTSDLTPVAVTAPLHPGPAQPAASTQQETMTIDRSAPAPPGMVKATEEVHLPQPEGGGVVYDSLWRVAERMFGDGNRWPELFAQNRGVVQPDRRALTKPHLIRPGWKITGYIPAPAPPVQPPNEQQPPVPPTQPPTPPPTTTQPAPSTTQAPASGNNNADHTGDQDAGDRAAPGVDLRTGVFVSLVLAGVISAAAVSARFWRRRRYRVGSGDRSDLHRPIAPVVRALRTAHDDNHTQTSLDEIDVVESTPGVHARVGVRGGRELALNLASTRGLGLLGPGATAAARALLLHLLAQHVQDGQHPRVLMPAPDLAHIFDGADIDRLPSTVAVVSSLDAALDEMEAELLTRTRHLIDETNSQPPTATLVLLSSPAPHAERRLQAVLDNGSTLGLAGILLGQWRPGATVRVRPDGTISATSPGIGDSLTGTRLFTLPATDATELLAVLREAEGPADLAPTDLVRPDVETDDDVQLGDEAQNDHAGEQLPLTGDQISVEELTQLESTRSPDTGNGDQKEPASPLQLLDVQATQGDPESNTDTPANVAEDDRHDVAGDTASADVDPTSVEAVHGPSPLSVEPPAGEGAGEAEPRRPWALRVLGRVELLLYDDDGNRELGLVLTPKQREVLVYLALHPQGVRREALNDAIWPDSRPPRPFNSLHNTLSLLRRALNDATDGAITDLVRNDDGRYHLDTGLVTTDFERFQRALHGPRTGGGDAPALLHEAIEMYQGDLAEDLTTAWVEPFRESIRRDVLDALGALIRAHGDSDPETMLVLLERSRKLDRYNEGLYRDIIRTQARLGRYDAIPRTLAVLATTLGDIGQQPSGDTLNLAEFLQRRGGTRRTSSDNAAAS